MDNVLFDATLWQRWLWHLVSRMGAAANYDDFCRTWDLKYLPDVYRGRRERAEAFEAFLLSVGLARGQVDEVQAGLDAGEGTLVPISGKGGQDKLSWSQALNLNTYAAEKPPMPGLKVRSIGLWRDALNTIWIVEFSPHTDIDQIEIVNVRRFKFQ